MEFIKLYLPIHIFDQNRQGTLEGRSKLPNRWRSVLVKERRNNELFRRWVNSRFQIYILESSYWLICLLAINPSMIACILHLNDWYNHIVHVNLASLTFADSIFVEHCYISRQEFSREHHEYKLSQWKCSA